MHEEYIRETDILHLIQNALIYFQNHSHKETESKKSKEKYKKKLKKLEKALDTYKSNCTTLQLSLLEYRKVLAFFC